MKLYVVLAVLFLVQLINARLYEQNAEEKRLVTEENEKRLLREETAEEKRYILGDNTAEEKRFLPLELLGALANAGAGVLNAGTDLAGGVIQTGGQLAQGAGQTLQNLF